MEFSNLRFVILDSPYHNWNNPIVRDLWWETSWVKIDGYRNYYRDGILSIGDSDLVAVHQLICAESGGKFIPITGNQTLTIDRAKYHNIWPYSPLALARGNGQHAHAEIIEGIINRCEVQGRRLGYDSSWTIRPEVRKDKVLLKDIHQMFLALKVFSYNHYVDENLLAATLRFKVDDICKLFGYAPLLIGDKPLDPMPVPRFDNELTQMLHMPKLSPMALAFAGQYQSMWDNRIVIERAQDGQMKKAA